MTGVIQRIKPWLNPSLIGQYHNRSLPWSLGNPPTIGQALYIAMLIVLNLAFMSVGYDTLYPHGTFQWYENRYQELMAYWMWRTGTLAFCQMPLLFLFASRNNVLLWLTGWSHSTYLLLHRWIARLFLFQALLHSILALILYSVDGTYSESVSTPLWYWGCIATAASVVLILTSVLILRQASYELFLLTHILMSVVLLVGCWYHVWYDDEGCFGYATWLYATFAVWGFDRVVRFARILKTGRRKATVTEVTPTIVRVDIPGIRWAAPGHCAYAYFPTLSWYTPWVNHPFSVLETASLAEPHHASFEDHATTRDIKSPRAASSEIRKPIGPASNLPGITLFIRKRRGLTSTLR